MALIKDLIDPREFTVTEPPVAIGAGGGRTGAGSPTTVLIVGAGPTGLTLGILLARYGVAVRIIEKRTELSRHTKATNLMQRTLELLDGIALAEPLRQRGGAMNRVMLRAYGRVLPALDMHMRDSPFPDVVLCGQDEFERQAAAQLSRLGVPIEFGVALTGLSQDGKGCTAQVVRSASGTTETLRADWVVGADGAAGRTRAFTAMQFEPRRTGVVIRQVDATLRWRRSSTGEQMWLFYADRGFSAVVPLPGGVHRVLHVEPREDVPEREPTASEMQQRLRDVAGDPDAQLDQVRWASYTDLAMGLAPTLRDGRVLLAGDAGNPVLPNGGQGMNTGIADAFGLAWRLTAVSHHRAPGTLLDTYAAERHDLRARLQKAQHAGLRYSVLSTPAPARALVRWLAAPALAYGGGRAMARSFSELAVTARRSPITRQVGRGPGVRAGDRAPDAGVSHAGRTVRLRATVHDGAWTLLAFFGTGRRADPRGAAAALTAAPPMTGYLIDATSRPPEAQEAGIVTFDDPDGEAHRAYGYREPTVLLVRPDGYVAVRAPATRVDVVIDAIDRWAAHALPAYATTPSAI